MAQPSDESSPSRPQHHLDSSPVELHAHAHPPSEEQLHGKRQRPHDRDADHDADHDRDDQHGQHHVNAKGQRSPPLLARETPPPPTTTRSSSPSPYRDGALDPVGNGNGNGTRHAPRGDEEGASCRGPTTDVPPDDDRALPVAGTADPTDYARAGVIEARYSGGAPLSTSPSMSHPQPPQGPSRQPVSYPSPTSYPPPGLHPSYPYPSQPPPPQDHYRQAATSLPSMRTLDHVAPQQHQHQHQQHPHPHQQHQHPHHQPQQHAMPMNAHMAGPMAPAQQMAYYSVQPHVYGIHHDPNAMRFAIPPGMADPRIALSGGRHKKVPVQHVPSLVPPPGFSVVDRKLTLGPGRKSSDGQRRAA